MSLANVTLSHINFTANCSNFALGMNVWLNDFIIGEPTSGNLTGDQDDYTWWNTTADDGPTEEYTYFFTNGTSPEWLGFWRFALASALPSSYMSISDQDIAKWANTTGNFLFFDYLEVEPMDFSDSSFSSNFSQLLAREGGCNNNFKGNIKDLSGMARGCITNYCCSSALNSTIADNPKVGFPYYPNWTVEDTCSFHTCRLSNNGNPDLGGIGVLVAYIIEGSILALSIIVFTFKMFTDLLKHKRPDKRGKLLDSHDYAVLESSGVFLDTSVFFALSICFAAIIFNYRGEILLYETKLAQVSTLLTIDAPVATLLLSYRWLERLTLRTFVVVLTALMTFIIQFLFRRAHSFNPASNLCLNWDAFVKRVFRARFKVKAVWACLVFAFFIWKVFPWYVFRKPERAVKGETQSHPKIRVWQKLPLWNPMVASTFVAKVSAFCAYIKEPSKKVNWESLISYTLAVYALYDTWYDIQFLMFLRKQEQRISQTADTAENQWGYGQILALFVWISVIVEYTYALGYKLKFYKMVGRRLFELGCRMGLYERKKERESLITHQYEMVEQEQIIPKREDTVI